MKKTNEELILSEIIKLNNKIDGLTSEFQEFKAEMYQFKEEMHSFKEEMYEFKNEVREFMEETKENFSALFSAFNLASDMFQDHGRRITALEETA